MKKFKTIFMFSAAAVAGGCMVGPDYENPNESVAEKENTRTTADFGKPQTRRTPKAAANGGTSSGTRRSRAICVCVPKKIPT